MCSKSLPTSTIFVFSVAPSAAAASPEKETPNGGASRGARAPHEIERGYFRVPTDCLQRRTPLFPIPLAVSLARNVLFRASTHK